MLVDLEYVMDKKFELEEEDYIKDMQFLTHLTRKIYDIYPLKQRQFGMVAERRKIDYDGIAVKSDMMWCNERPKPFRKLNDELYKNYSKSTYSNENDIFNQRQEENKIRKEWINFIEKKNNGLSLSDFQEIFLSEDKLVDAYNRWLILEDLRKKEEERHKKSSKRKNTEKQYEEEKNKKKKKNLKRPKKTTEIIDTRGHIGKIINYDQIMNIKQCCEWSGPNVLIELHEMERMKFNNNLIEKIQTIDIIIWRQKYYSHIIY